MNSRTFGGLLQVAGVVLIVLGAMNHVSWGVIALGAGIGVIGFVAQSGVRLGGTLTLGDPLPSGDGSLQIVGDEIRCTKGYSVRKLADGVQYIEGERALSIRGSAPRGPLTPEQPQSQEPVSDRSPGTRSSVTTVTVRISSKIPLRWDPPNENDPISQDRLAEIIERIARAVTYYETHKARL